MCSAQKITALKYFKTPALLYTQNKSVSRYGSGLSISDCYLICCRRHRWELKDRFVKCWETIHDLKTLLTLLKTGFHSSLSQNFCIIWAGHKLLRSSLSGSLPWISITPENWIPDNPRYNLEGAPHCLTTIVLVEGMLNTLKWQVFRKKQVLATQVGNLKRRDRGFSPLPWGTSCLAPFMPWILHNSLSIHKVPLLKRDTISFLHKKWARLRKIDRYHHKNTEGHNFTWHFLLLGCTFASLHFLKGS